MTTVAPAARAQACGDIPSAQQLVRGVGTGSGGGEVVFANPRAELGVFNAEGDPLPGWSLSINGEPVVPAPEGLAPGSYELVAVPGPGCGAYEPVRARLTIDADAPELTWKVADRKSVEAEVPDMGRDKRFLWWWVQPEKRRLVWSDGLVRWAPLRQKVGVEIAASPGGNRLYVWAPDETPFASVGGDITLDEDRVLIIEANDTGSGVGGLRLRLLEKGSRADTADPDAEYVLVAEVTDKVGNHTQVELPYIAEQKEGPRKGPF